MRFSHVHGVIGCIIKQQNAIHMTQRRYVTLSVGRSVESRAQPLSLARMTYYILDVI